MLQIPYVFVAGTKAKAQEVNDNFTEVAKEVNANASSIASAQQSITTLTNTKANINGDAQNRFSVANPVNNGDAINKKYLTTLISDAIFGLSITKSDDDYITCTAGATFDSTKSVLLSFEAEVSKQNANQSASTTYYVYIIGNQDGTATDLHFSTSSDNPAMPSGYTLFKKLGYFITDSNAKIDSVYGANLVDGKEFSSGINAMFFNAGNPISKAWGEEYTAETDGYLFVYVSMRQGYSNGIYIDDVQVGGIHHFAINGALNTTFVFIVKKGQKYKTTGSNAAATVTFYKKEGA